jgi:hypothetical protein
MIAAMTAAKATELWQEALLFGIISALSLPIGAFLGQWLSPVSDVNVAAIVAFGAGALLFAVTVELYGHALHEVAHGSLGYTEMFTTVACALLGALMYLWLNKMMENWVSGEDDENQSEPASAEPKAKAKAEPKAKALARWDTLRRHASDVGSEAVRERRRTLSAQEALSLFLNKTNPEHHKKMKAVRGRKKRMLLAAGATHPTYGSVTSAGADEDEESRKERQAEGMRLAYAMFLGLLVDGIPESILLGFLAAENSLSLVLVLSLFVANFPEAFSSASLMKEAGVSVFKIVGMWSALCAITGILAALACAGLLWFAGDAVAAGGDMPFHISMTIAVVEGIAGGAMIACIAAVMLPEAFGRKSQTNILMDSGFLCTAGFLCAVLIKVVGGVVHLEQMKLDGTVSEPKQHGVTEHVSTIKAIGHFLHVHGLEQTSSSSIESTVQNVVQHLSHLFKF